LSAICRLSAVRRGARSASTMRPIPRIGSLPKSSNGRWNQAFERVRELEQRIAPHCGTLQEEPTPTKEVFAALAERLEELWRDHADARLRKRVSRWLMHAVIVSVSTAPQARSGDPDLEKFRAKGPSATSGDWK
jgi:hypothetical protein